MHFSSHQPAVRIITLCALGLMCAVLILLGAAQPSQAVEPAAPDVVNLTIQPASISVFPGQVFTVSLSISGITKTGGYEATLFFDPSLIQFQAVTHPAPGFLAVNGRSTDSPAGDPLVDNVIGRITTAEYSYAVNNPVGAGGSGVLAHIRFKALALGISPLTFSSEALYPVLLVDTNGTDIAFTSAGGSVNIVQPMNTFLPIVYR